MAERLTHIRYTRRQLRSTLSILSSDVIYLKARYFPFTWIYSYHFLFCFVCFFVLFSLVWSFLCKSALLRKMMETVASLSQHASDTHTCKKNGKSPGWGRWWWWQRWWWWRRWFQPDLWRVGDEEATVFAKMCPPLHAAAALIALLGTCADCCCCCGLAWKTWNFHMSCNFPDDDEGDKETNAPCPPWLYRGVGRKVEECKG